MWPRASGIITTNADAGDDGVIGGGYSMEHNLKLKVNRTTTSLHGSRTSTPPESVAHSTLGMHPWETCPTISGCAR